MVIFKKIWGKLNTFGSGLKHLLDRVVDIENGIDNILDEYKSLVERIINLEEPLPDEIKTIKFKNLNLAWHIKGDGDFVSILDSKGKTVASEVQSESAQAIVSIMGTYVD